MPNHAPAFLSFETTESLRLAGVRLREARLARRHTEQHAAERLGVNRATWSRLERGDPNVRAGTWLQALLSYQLSDRVLGLAEADPLTQTLATKALPKKGALPKTAT
jgi:transcriptional regulator with XRE-family HTH domain